VLSTQREEGDEDDLLPDILKRMGIGLVSGCWWALAWVASGLRAGLCAGLLGQVRQVSLFFYFSFISSL
jgi:hypothetical protein